MKCSSWEMKQREPGVVFEGVFQDVAAGDVEVVGRLVHHDEVVGDGEDLGQAEPGLLAAGEGGDGFIRGVSAEEEGAEHPAEVAVGQAGVDLPEAGEDGRLQVQGLDAVLGEVGGEDVAAELDLAPGRLVRTPARSFIRVVLPAPLGPTRTTRSPRWISRSIRE